MYNDLKKVIIQILKNIKQNITFYQITIVGLNNFKTKYLFIFIITLLTVQVYIYF